MRLPLCPCLVVLAALTASAFAPAPLPRRRPADHGIVGVWYLEGSRGVEVAWSVPVRYTRDGRVMIAVGTDEGGAPTGAGDFQTGTYRVEGDLLVVTEGKGGRTTAALRFPSPDRLVLYW